MIRNDSLLCLLGILTYFAISTVAREAIINGDLAKLAQFPYQVSIQRPEHVNNCGGSIIGEEFVLTAAHCVVMNDGHITTIPISIVAGTTDLNLAFVRISVKKVYILKSFKKREIGGKGDIAVLKLKSPLPLKDQYIKKLELPHNDHESFGGKTATITGFGLNWIEIENNKVVKRSRTDTHLRYAETDVLDYYPTNHAKFPVPKEIIIAKIKLHGSLKPRGTCAGDSGSPLVHAGIVIGVLNVGSTDCIENNSAGIYARVSHYLDFIHHAIHDEHHDDIITAELPH